ncbi:MAG TPA: hypothetical protein PKG72_08775 [Smithellaceae bacterium]|jgi:hypothetical protein|nr:hypothetical protein [Smithellaceae bacterium]HOH56902.1 hypothetical protein [Smithellaceae bacterium]HPB14925.1 hypothetical protein [Smithellaceae bacterium]HQP05799.1 hypothetical protein [Smithellaceae bacterium]
MAGNIDVVNSTAPSMPPTVKPILKPKPNASRFCLNSTRNTPAFSRRKNPNAEGLEPMPKYRYKKKLQAYIAQHGKPDALTEYFILNGYSEEDIKKGIAPFVEAWEEAIYWIEGGDVEEYDWDLRHRSMLYEVLRHATDKQIEPYRERIKMADKKFRSITREVETSYGHLAVKKESLNRQTHWWLFRIPKHGVIWRDCG